MGYKLAGFDVIGCNEIDPRMNKCYVDNHHPKYNFLCDIREMVKAVDLPAELYNLDVLDGSPPCSTFSMAGSREDAWGVEKKFREGQKAQVLDTLFFDFIDLAKKLQPKVVVAENVKGLLLGSAKKYVMRIYDEFDKAGYYCQHFLLDSSKMGVPQRRERTFFLCLKKELATKFLRPSSLFEEKPYIDMKFKESPIYFKDVSDYKGREITKGSRIRYLWDNHITTDNNLADVCLRLEDKRSLFNFVLFKENKIPPTLTSAEHDCMLCEKEPVHISSTEMIKISSFPMDYKASEREIGYMCGMSVPPVMMAQVASRIWDYWLSKL